MHSASPGHDGKHRFRLNRPAPLRQQRHVAVWHTCNRLVASRVSCCIQLAGLVLYLVEDGWGYLLGRVRGRLAGQSDDSQVHHLAQLVNYPPALVLVRLFREPAKRPSPPRCEAPAFRPPADAPLDGPRPVRSCHASEATWPRTGSTDTTSAPEAARGVLCGAALSADGDLVQVAALVDRGALVVVEGSVDQVAGPVDADAARVEAAAAP